MGSIQSAQEEAEFIVLTSDVPLFALTPQTEISQATDPGHTLYKLKLLQEFFSSQDQLILLPFVAANHFLRATCCAQHPLVHEPQNTTSVESVQE